LYILYFTKGYFGHGYTEQNDWSLGGTWEGHGRDTVSDSINILNTPQAGLKLEVIMGALENGSKKESN
jgi:hypothetical protein